MQTAVVKIIDGEKSFPGVRALKKVNIELYPHEITGLVGENGAGKSTLLGVLSGLSQLDSGSYVLRDQKVKFSSTNMALKHGVGVVSQEGTILANLSVSENLFVGHEQFLGCKAFSKSQQEKRITEELLEEFGMNVQSYTVADRLSMAEKQMLEIIRIIWLTRQMKLKHPLVILDEVTTVLNDKERNLLFKHMNYLRQQGCMIVFVSHRLSEIVEICQRLIALKDGEKVGELYAQEISTEKIEHLIVGRNLVGGYFHEDKQQKADDQVVLSLDKLTKEGQFQQISFSLRRGEILSLIGLVGSGKEHLLSCLYGLKKADSGSIFFKGSKINLKNPKDAITYGIGYIPANRREEGLILQKNVAENLSLLVLKSLSWCSLFIRLPQYRRWVEKQVKQYQIKTAGMHSLCLHLSGGNQQKIVLAKWLAKKVDVLLLDHPTRGVDVGAKSEIYKQLRESCRQGMSFILLGDSLEEDIALAHRALLMKDGLIVKEIDTSKSESVDMADLMHAII